MSDSLHPSDYRTYLLYSTTLLLYSTLLYSTLLCLLPVLLLRISLLLHPIVLAISCYLFTCSSLSYCRRQHWSCPDPGFAPQSVTYPTYLGGTQATLQLDRAELQTFSLSTPFEKAIRNYSHQSSGLSRASSS